MLPDVLVSGSDSWRSVAEKLMSICLRVQRSAAKSHKPQAPDVVSGVREDMWAQRTQPTNWLWLWFCHCLNGVFNLCVAYVRPQKERKIRSSRRRIVPHGEGSTTGTCPSISHVTPLLAKNLIKLLLLRVLILL